ncbi:MAG: DNA-3-methyladenine glycosylase [Acidimicrobiaceae bacterium]|nr:DNA-3-methyladenine glycosylase [Acidimicrobiaceae bacterium]
MSDTGLAEGTDGRLRCSWGASSPDYVEYHDTEWGFPVGTDETLFEKLCLEGFQAGLSWLTILRKRPAFREAFSQFDIETVAGFGDIDIERMLGDAGIVRHRGKIVSTINNARRALELQAEFDSLAAYLWRWEPDSGRADAGSRPPTVPLPPTTAESHALSKDLRRRGWTFVGPTTVYAFMQAMGLVNDHMAGCWCRGPAEEARDRFTRPGPDFGSADPPNAS